MIKKKEVSTVKKIRLREKLRRTWLQSERREAEIRALSPIGRKEAKERIEDGQRIIAGKDDGEYMGFSTLEELHRAILLLMKEAMPRTIQDLRDPFEPAFFALVVASLMNFGDLIAEETELHALSSSWMDWRNYLPIKTPNLD